MTVIQFPGPTASPKPGKDHSKGPAQILVFPPIAVWRELPTLAEMDEAVQYLDGQMRESLLASFGWPSHAAHLGNCRCCYLPAEQIVKQGASMQHLWDEADATWPPPAGAGSD